jgi:hypothetical protein
MDDNLLLVTYSIYWTQMDFILRNYSKNLTTELSYTFR